MAAVADQHRVQRTLCRELRRSGVCAPASIAPIANDMKPVLAAHIHRTFTVWSSQARPVGARPGRTCRSAVDQSGQDFADLADE